jgi:branched-chain amino acid transport system substrate-binding protein
MKRADKAGSLSGESILKADKAGSLSGESILKNGFETLRGFDIGLSVPPLNYTATDHRIAGKLPIYEIKGGKFEIVQVVDLKKRWPDKWANEWLGW